MYKLSKYLGHSVTGINLPYFAHLHGAAKISVAECEQRYMLISQRRNTHLIQTAMQIPQTFYKLTLQNINR